ncbi:MAG: hypothetical protein ABSB95_08305 [Dissulfurispiraceae bacterium]|jgi:predicted nucleic acid-binding Zn finger protein
MTTKEIVKRNGKSEGLRVLKVEEGSFYVSSSDGKICYLVNLNGKEACTCADYVNNIKKDVNFRCKHILAVIACDRDYESGEFLERKIPKLDNRFISNIQGREFVLYAGLLDLAHQKGLLKLVVETLQIPDKDNGFEAICKAIAESRTGEVFIDIGDANARNCNKTIANHIIRMASTRAKARALRDFTNVGMTALEELGDIEEVIAGGNGNGKNKKTLPQTTRKSVASDPGNQNVTTDKGNGKPYPDKPATDKSNGDHATSSVKTESKNNGGEKPKSSGNNGNGTETVSRISEAQKRAMLNLAKRRGVSEDELNKMAKDQYGVSAEELSSGDAGVFIRQLQSAA